MSIFSWGSPYISDISLIEFRPEGKTPAAEAAAASEDRRNLRINVTDNYHFLGMKYGCIPVASRSGIYNDTIADIFDDITYGCGFKTKIPLNTEDDSNEIFLSAVMKALNLYTNNPSSWNLLIKNAMNYNSGWTFEIIEKYNKIYELM